MNIDELRSHLENRLNYPLVDIQIRKQTYFFEVTIKCSSGTDRGNFSVSIPVLWKDFQTKKQQEQEFTRIHEHANEAFQEALSKG